MPVKGKKSKGKEDGGDVVHIRVNKGAVVNEIQRLGGEMVSRVDVKAS